MVADAVKKIEEEITPMEERVGALVVDSTESMEVAADTIRDIKSLRKKVNETFDPIVKAAYASHQETKTQQKKHLEPLDAAERAVKGKMGAYQDEQERLQREEEARMQEEARKAHAKALAAAERRIKTLMERSKDTQGQINALKAELESAELSDVEVDTIHAQIEILEAKLKGNADEVERKRAAAETAKEVPIAVVPAPAPAKVAGVSSHKKAVVTITDPMAIIKGVADGTIPVGVITFDKKAMGKLVDAKMKIPGIRITYERITSVRG